MSTEEIEKLNLSVDVVSNVLRDNGANTEMKEMVLNYVLMISGREGNDQLLKGSLMNDLLDVADRHDDNLGKMALRTLVNTSSEDAGALWVADGRDVNAQRVVRLALNSGSTLSDDACKLLANLSRLAQLADKVAEIVVEEPGLSVLTKAVSDKTYNKRCGGLAHLAQVVGNLCQSESFRKRILDPTEENLSRVLPVIHTSPSQTERYGIVSAVYNCLFDTTTHETLMNPPFEVLPFLLLPLAGPEEFDAEDYDKMPLELQYLPDDKTREEDPAIRNLLLRSLLHLCATRKVRSQVRDFNTYYILREYHKWEKDRPNLLAVENVIDLLIRTEDEIGVDNLGGLTVPEDLKDKFEKMDSSFLTDD